MDYELVIENSSLEDLVDVFNQVSFSLDFQAQDSQLGIGSFGRVELKQHKDYPDIRVAVKHALPVTHEIMKIQLKNEIDVQKHLQHINIVRLYKCFETEESTTMLLELCDAGEVFQLMKNQPSRRFDEKTAFSIFIQALSAVHYMHCHGVMHRDLKPENLLMTP